jgi:choice-of-anchor C domain-containing protein
MKFISAIVAVAGLSIAGVASAGNLVGDGQFDTPLGSPPFQTVNSGDSLGGWSVGGGSVDFISTYWEPPPGGGGSVDLDGNSPGSISQNINTVVGQGYELSFYLSGNPDGGFQTTTGTVSVGPVGGPILPGSVDSFSFATPATSPFPQDKNHMDYVLETFFFTAGSSTDLVFTGTNGGDFGPVIGDVSITAVPEPASWALMILGVALAGGALRYGRQLRPELASAV